MDLGKQLDEDVLQTSQANAELALIERYRAPKIPDPKDPTDPKKAKDNPLYINCGQCKNAKNDCTADFELDGRWSLAPGGAKISITQR